MNNSTSGRVLALGADARMLLPIARSLGRHGIEVDLGWVPEESSVRRCRYVRRFHDLPTLARPDAWTARLADLQDEHGYDLVLSATEPVACAVHRERRRLHAVPIHLTPPRAFDIARDKRRTAELAEHLGLPTPLTRFVGDRDHFEDAVLRCEGPLVVKPLTSIGNSTPSRKRFVQRFASNRGALVADVEFPCLVQEVFVGEGVGIGFLAKKGQILRAMQHVRLHETTGHGSTYRRSEPLSPDLLDAARRLAAGLDYTGVGMFEFRRNPHSGEWVLIEANPRFWGSLPLSLAAGVEFAWNLYELLVLERTQFPQEYRAGVQCRSLAEDLRFTRVCLNRGRARRGGEGWQVNDVSGWRIAADWLRLLFGRDSFDTFAWDDTGPARAEVAGVFRSVGRVFRPGLVVDTAVPTFDAATRETTPA